MAKQYQQYILEARGNQTIFSLSDGTNLQSYMMRRIDSFILRRMFLRARNPIKSWWKTKNKGQEWVFRLEDATTYRGSSEDQLSIYVKYNSYYLRFVGVVGLEKASEWVGEYLNNQRP